MNTFNKGIVTFFNPEKNSYPVLAWLKNVCCAELVLKEHFYLKSELFWRNSEVNVGLCLKSKFIWRLNVKGAFLLIIASLCSYSSENYEMNFILNHLMFFFGNYIKSESSFPANFREMDIAIKQSVKIQWQWNPISLSSSESSNRFHIDLVHITILNK